MTDFNRDTWATPQYLFDWLDLNYSFDIDLCASDENKKADHFFCEEMDGLCMSWHDYGRSGFCNPPYSNIKPWVLKAVEEAKNGFTTAMLIPTPNGESYYKEVFTYARKITFIHGRIAFFNPIEKKEIGGNTRGSCIVEFSPAKQAGEPLIVDHVERDAIKLLINGV